MRPGRLPETDPREIVARAKLGAPSPQAAAKQQATIDSTPPSRQRPTAAPLARRPRPSRRWN